MENQLSFAEVGDVARKSQVMSQYEDVDIVYLMLKFLQPRNILELGVGGGGWISCMNALLKDKSIHWFGFENFSLNYNLPWPKTADELRFNMQETSVDLGFPLRNVQIIDDDLNNINFGYFQKQNLGFDVVRLDCLGDCPDIITNVLSNVLTYTTKDCLILVDDVVPNIALNRLLGTLELVKRGVLKVLWTGKKEMALVKTTFNEAPIIRFLLSQKEIKEKFYKMEYQNIKFFGYRRNYLRTH